MGLPENHPAIVQARAKGLIVETSPRKGEAAPAKPELVAASFHATAASCVWVVPLRVAAGDNQRGGRAKIGRAGHERRVVSRCLGGATLKFLAGYAECAARGERVRVTLTRLGGRALDDDNAVAAMKFVRDAVATMLGFDDGPASPLVFATGQEPGGPFGVRIELASREGD